MYFFIIIIFLLMQRKEGAFIHFILKNKMIHL